MVAETSIYAIFKKGLQSNAKAAVQSYQSLDAWKVCADKFSRMVLREGGYEMVTCLELP